MSPIAAALTIAGKDLRIEARTKEITLVTTFFAILVVVLSSLSFYLDRNLAARIAPGVLWVSLAFAGLLAVLRSWSREREHDAMQGLLLSPIPRGAIFFGKAMGNLLFLTVVELVLVPLVGVFFHLALDHLGTLALLLALGTFGFVTAGTLFGALGVRSNARDLALSVVIFPLLAPALLGGVVATRELFAGAPFAELVGWVQILAAFDLVFLGAGWLLFDALLSD